MSDALVASDLAAIAKRLAALASDGGEPELIARELAAIRAQLQLLARENDEVRARLATFLDLPPAD